MPLIPWMLPWETGRRPESGRRWPGRGLPWGSEVEWFGSVLPGFFDPDSDSPAWNELFRGLQSFPPIEVQETEAAYVITANLPGFDRNQIELAIDENVLTIRGTQDEIIREEREGLIRQERRTGSFVRHMPLPEDVRAEGIRSEFDKGVLRVTIPRTGRAAGDGRRMEIS